MGMRNLLILLYATMAIFIPHLIYFWLSVLSLCIAPFLFNPHQFSYADFIIDYREFLRWMSRGNSRTKASSWYGYCRLSRTMITGYKKKKLGHPSEKLSGDVPRASWRNVLFSEVISPLLIAFMFIVAYMFVKSFPDPKTGLQNPSPLIRIGIIALGPVVWNAAVLVALFFIALFLGPMMDSWAKFGSVMAGIAHVSSLVGIIAFFEFFVRFSYLLCFIPDAIHFSGSWNFGMRLTPYLVSFVSSRFNVPFKRSLLLCSLLVNTSMTRQIEPGGQVNGTVEVWVIRQCRNRRESSSLRSLKCLYGAPTSCLDIFC